MKQGTLFLLSILLIISIGACSTESAVKNQITIDLLKQNIGLEKTKVFENLQLIEGEQVIVSNSGTGMYLLTEEQSFHNSTLQLELQFDAQSEVMYGFVFGRDFADEMEAGYKLAIKLHEDVMKQEGEPDTYPELSNSFQNLPSFAEMDWDEPSTFVESWSGSDGLTIKLQIIVIPGAGLRVVVQYAELKLPNEK